MANVKITALTNIGSNISYSALIPMVNMSGTPVTQQGNIQILGNYILSSAGSANFVPAALSNIAYSVVNAAQPNITSVGTLTSLTVTGNVTSSSYMTANFFVGDGGLLTNLSVAGSAISNGTSNVSIPAAGGNINISRGGVANVLVVSGAGITVAGNTTTTNLNITGNVNSNLLPNANVTYNLGSSTQRWNDIWLANSTIYLGDATISANGNSIIVDSITITDGNVGSIGNIASINLDGNANSVLRGDGTWGEGGGGGGLPLSNGTSNFNIATANGNATITANSTFTWEFDNTGNLVLPVNAFAFKYANGDPIAFNQIGNFVVSGNMFMLNDPNVDMVIQQSETDMTSIRLVPDGNPDSGVHIETGNSPAMYHWLFDDTGNFFSPGNVHLDGAQIFAGPGADLLPNIANTTLVISSNSEAFIQAVINNVSDVGSADWIAQGHYGDDDGGYVDLGFNSSAHNDPDYDMTGPGDGYILVEGYYPGQAPVIGGGNLILATGSEGTNKDIIFGTGGYTTANVFAKFNHNNNVFEITRANAYIQLPDGSVFDAGGIYGSDTAVLSNGSGAVQAYAQSTGFGIQTGDGNATINTWTFGNDGNLTLPDNTFSVNYANGTQVPLGGGGGSSISNGTSNVDIATSNGPVTLTSAGQTWTVGTDGSLTAPNNSNIYPAGNNFNVYAPVAGAIQFYTDSGNFNWSLDGYGVMNLPFASAMSNTALVYSAGNLRIDAGANNFMFTDTGTVIFPTMTVDLHNGGNQYAQTLQFGDDTQQAVITGPTPSANVNAQRLIIQGQRGNGTGEGGDVYFWAGDADTNGGDIKIYAGDADNVSAGYGGYINLDGGSGYDGGGQISLTGGYSANGPGGTVNISAGQGGTDGGGININGGSAGANQGGNIALQAGYGGNNGGEVRLTGGSAGTGIPGYGNIVLVSGASTWTFDNGGLLSLPGGNTKIGLQYGSEAILASNTSFGVATQGANVTTFMNWSDDVANTSVMSAIYVNAPNANPGDIHFRTGNVGSPNFWQFNVDGNLVLPNGNSVIYSIANSSLDPTLPNVSTMTLTPDANYSQQALVLDPTAPGHIHLRAYASSNIDEPAANIFLGGETTSFEVTQGLTPQARIHSGSNTWVFTNTGDIQTPSGAVISPDGANGILIQSGDYSNDYAYTSQSGTGQSYQAYVENDQSANSAWAGMTATLLTTNTPLVKIETQKASDGVNHQWQFDATGNLTIPGSISGADRITANVYQTNVIAYASLPAASVAGLRSFINDANLVAAGNFGATVSGGGSNTVPVYSDGTNWCIG